MKDRSSARTVLRLTRRIIVTGATKSRSANAVITIDFGFEFICRLQTRYTEKAVIIRSVMILMAPVAAHRASIDCPSASL